MFGFLKRKMDERPDYDRIIAAHQGQIVALHLVLGATIDRLPKAERTSLVALLRLAVGRGFGGQGEFLNEQYRQVYNDAISGILQRFIEDAEDTTAN